MASLSVLLQLCFFTEPLSLWRWNGPTLRRSKLRLVSKIKDATSGNRVALTHFLIGNHQSFGFHDVCACIQLTGKMFTQGLFVTTNVAGNALMTPVRATQDCYKFLIFLRLCIRGPSATIFESLYRPTEQIKFHRILVCLVVFLVHGGNKISA